MAGFGDTLLNILTDYSNRTVGRDPVREQLERQQLQALQNAPALAAQRRNAELAAKVISLAGTKSGLDYLRRSQDSTGKGLATQAGLPEPGPESPEAVDPKTQAYIDNLKDLAKHRADMVEIERFKANHGGGAQEPTTTKFMGGLAQAAHNALEAGDTKRADRLYAEMQRFAPLMGGNPIGAQVSGVAPPQGSTLSDVLAEPPAPTADTETGGAGAMGGGAPPAAAAPEPPATDAEVAAAGDAITPGNRAAYEAAKKVIMRHPNAILRLGALTAAQKRFNGGAVSPPVTLPGPGSRPAVAPPPAPSPGLRAGAAIGRTITRSPGHVTPVSQDPKHAYRVGKAVLKAKQAVENAQFEAGYPTMDPLQPQPGQGGAPQDPNAAAAAALSAGGTS